MAGASSWQSAFTPWRLLSVAALTAAASCGGRTTHDSDTGSANVTSTSGVGSTVPIDLGGITNAGITNTATVSNTSASSTVGSTGFSTGGTSAVSSVTSGGIAGDAGAGPVLFGCDRPQEIVIGGIATGVFQCAGGYDVRRQPIATCPNLLPPKGAGGGGGADGSGPVHAGDFCSSDADCEGLGYCKTYGDGLKRCRLGCQLDSDCVAGTICRCGDPIGTCAVAMCHTSTDCPDDSECASVNEECPDLYAYSCQQAFEGCASSADCPAGYLCQLVNGVRTCRAPDAECFE